MKAHSSAGLCLSDGVSMCAVGDLSPLNPNRLHGVRTIQTVGVHAAVGASKTRHAMMKGIHSSRKMGIALHEDVGSRFLAGNQQPDHWIISKFRKRYHMELGGLFEQTVAMADRGGLVRLWQVAIDGTKISANASKYRAMSDGG